MPPSKSSSVEKIKNEVDRGIQIRQERKITDVQPIYSPMNIEPCEVIKLIEQKVAAPEPPPPPACNHFTGVGLFAARQNLSMSGRINMLAAPKKRQEPPPVPPSSPEIAVTRTIPPCSMRISNLAKPITRKVLLTWEIHQDHLSGDKKRNFKELLEENDFMTIDKANKILYEHREYQKFLEVKLAREKRRVFLSKRRESKRVAEKIIHDVADEVVLISTVSEEIERKWSQTRRDPERSNVSHEIAKGLVKFFQENDVK